MPKEKPPEPKDRSAENGNRTMNVSLFIILLAFFIVLNSIAVVDENAKREALGSLIGSFGILPGGLSPMDAEGKGKSLKPPIHPLMDATEESLPDFVGLSGESSAMVDIRSTSNGSLISIRDQLLFSEGSYSIKPSVREFLTRLAEIVNGDSFPVVITGHTDDRPAEEKGVTSNWDLSARRAMAIYRFFYEQYLEQMAARERENNQGRTPALLPTQYFKRMDAYGCGSYQPIASNDTPQTRKLNNRVEILLDKRANYKLQRIYKNQSSGLFVFKKFVFSVLD
ncbi:MAG: OmpA family protein [Desulfatibacillum sp.]|nr:OmpA family protein [Desulfatibacillum sp.]